MDILEHELFERWQRVRSLAGLCRRVKRRADAGFLGCRVRIRARAKWGALCAARGVHGRKRVCETVKRGCIRRHFLYVELMFLYTC